VLYLLDPPEVIRRKVMRAVTDTANAVRYDPEHQPGVANLLDILAGCRDETPTALAGSFGSYRELKEAVADTVVATLRPIQDRYAELTADPGTVRAILRAGAERAGEQTQAKVRQVRARLGLL
jgi:tryptophanyl-tRNA synthetase